MAIGRESVTVSDLNILDTVRRIMAESGRLGVDAATLPPDADLYDAGLSSMATVQVMLAIEEAFDLEFPDRLLNRRTFRSLGALSLAVAELRAVALDR